MTALAGGDASDDARVLEPPRRVVPEAPAIRPVPILVDQLARRRGGGCSPVAESVQLLAGDGVDERQLLGSERIGPLGRIGGVHRLGDLPVVIAGGKKLPELEALELCYNAINCGAAGVDMGRNVFQSEAPLAMIQAVAGVVHDGLKPEEAFEKFNDLK